MSQESTGKAGTMIKPFAAASFGILAGYLFFVEARNGVALAQSGFPFPLDGVFALLLNAACIGFAFWVLGKGVARRLRNKGRGSTG